MHDPNASSENQPPLLSAVQPSGTRPVSRARWWTHLLLIAAYPLSLGILASLNSAERGPALSGDLRVLFFVCVVELLIFGTVFGLAWLASRASRDDLLLRWRNGFWPVPLGIGYSVALRIGTAVAILIISMGLVLTHVVSQESLDHFLGANRPRVEAVVDIAALQNPVYLLLTVTFVSFVLGGFREELWRSAFLAGLRTLWPRWFGSRGGQIGAAAIAAVLFGIGHLPMGIVAVGMTGLLGFGLGVIMVLHRSIWPAVIAHGMFDATTIALLPFLTKWLKELAPTVGQ